MKSPIMSKTDYETRPPLERDMDVISVYRLDRSKVVSMFIDEIEKARNAGFDNFQIDLAHLKGFFPNVIVPLSGIIKYYKSQGIDFEFKSMDSALSKTNFINPSQYRDTEPYILNRVWEFTNASEVGAIVDAYELELRKEDRFSPGIIKSLTWSLNEVMDNVFIHSEAGSGYVMGQLHQKTKKVAFTIFDLGIGIYNSLRNSVFHPHHPLDAITLAIKEEVTRDRAVGQGNGLFGLHSIVKNGKGRLEIVSSGASYRYNNGEILTFKYLPMLSKDRPGTIVDFQLSYDKEISLSDALVLRGKSYSIVDMYLESFEDDSGNNYFCIKEHADGTGTREAAIRLKNEVMNLLTETKKPIILDFKDIAVMSSSFADELIAKLLLELGLFQFNNLIKLRGLDIEQQNILQRSVVQRLVDTLNEPALL